MQQKHLAVFGLERHHLAQNAVILLGKIAGGGRQILKRNASVRMAQPRGAQLIPTGVDGDGDEPRLGIFALAQGVQALVGLEEDLLRSVLGQRPILQNAPAPAATPAVEAQPADALTLEEKVGQLFIVRPDALDLSLSQETINDAKADGVTTVTNDMRRALQQYPVGGICQFGKNIESPSQLARFNKELQDASATPLFIAVDEEGGLIARLANNDAFTLPRYASAAAVGASGDPEDARAMGQTIGAYLKEYGFTMDFAPDADVNTNPDNPIIGTRAFSSDAGTAAAMAAAMADGLRQNGILPTLKHFPGHGDTAEDSHTALAVTYKTQEELVGCELLPFGADTGLHAVMVGHIAAPNVTGSDTPATLSPQLVAMIPNAEDTLIITDSLAMDAIADAYTPGEAAVLSLQAGC